MKMAENSPADSFMIRTNFDLQCYSLTNTHSLIRNYRTSGRFRCAPW